ncbi:MAG: exo-alpha-sialidase [Chloroflexi bacterium]|nr:exo-alpha-sialidase [Chloroflexota bacterium]
MQLTRRSLAVVLALAFALSSTLTASAVTIVKLSTDPYTNTSSSHQTEVEPDSFAWGSTVVMVTQAGRFFDGGSSNIGWATSTDAGATWTNGFLNGITVYAGGIYDRVSDPAVAYDAKHNVWLIISLPIDSSPSVRGAAAGVNRSTDGGLTWGNLVTVAIASGSTFFDKTWGACDNNATSLFYGNCYVEWDNNSLGNQINMSTSTDGGLTWGPVKKAGSGNTGLGGQMLSRPNGAVIVPIDDASEANVMVFNSTNGGSTWSRTKKITNISVHGVAGSMRAPSLVTAEMDASGKTYVAWHDCRFESGCSANDIVMTTSTTGSTWTAVTRIPLDGVGSGVDHFIAGLAVDRNTSGTSAHLAVTYYYYPVANCGSSCQLNVGYSASTDGGTTWSAPVTVAGPMQTSWIVNTSQGRMVGDYVSTSYTANGLAHPAFSNANAPTGSTFDQALYSVVGGLTPRGGNAYRVANDPVLSTQSDYPASTTPATAN